jgi:hypothetical protein
LRTNCSEAAFTSSGVTGGSKLKRVLMFRHMEIHIAGCIRGCLLAFTMVCHTRHPIPGTPRTSSC